MSELERKPHRSICSICNREYAIEFKVPDDVWELATHHSQRESLICLDCFTRMADTRFVQWDKDIKFFPTSLVTHIKQFPLESERRGQARQDIESTIAFLRLLPQEVFGRDDKLGYPYRDEMIHILERVIIEAGL